MGVTFLSKLIEANAECQIGLLPPFIFPSQKTYKGPYEEKRVCFSAFFLVFFFFLFIFAWWWVRAFVPRFSRSRSDCVFGFWPQSWVSYRRDTNLPTITRVVEGERDALLCFPRTLAFLDLSLSSVLRLPRSFTFLDPSPSSTLVF